MTLLLASQSTRDKIEKNRKEHWREYRPRFYRAKIATWLFVCMAVAGTRYGTGGEDWGFWLAGIGIGLFSFMPRWLFNLGNEDDRAYFLRCIDTAEDEYELSEMGFEKYDKIKGMVFEKLLAGDLEDIAWSQEIRDIHAKFDLRKVADEVEDYERSIG